MKKIFLLTIVACAAMMNVSAQTETTPHQGKNVIGVSPFRLINGFRVKYERILNDKFTVGGTATYYYGETFPGLQVAPAARFYFKRNAPEGIYSQFKLVVSHHNYRYNVELYEDDNSFEGHYLGTVSKKQPFTNFGAGIACGYQIFWGKNNRWSVDINVGLKFVGIPPEPDNNDALGYIYTGVVDTASWSLTGPGSIVDGLVSIGYRF